MAKQLFVSSSMFFLLGREILIIKELYHMVEHIYMDLDIHISDMKPDFFPNWPPNPV